ncbi:MAG TPA: phosphotransferase [Propionicimonas sp.]|nr:phosphotransferase [Propionicimonas sp.]
MNMHEGQLALDVGQVRRLVASQFPQWAGLPVHPVASAGTVNALFRIGEGLVARFPLVGADAEAVRRDLELEAGRSAELADGTSVPTPVPIALGEPGEGYGLSWSVQTWLPGTDAFTDDPGGSVGFAADPALDLVAAWHLLEPGPRQVFRDLIGCTDLEWDRGRAWALEQAMGAAWYYEQTNPAMSRMGVRTIERLLAAGGH